MGGNKVATIHAIKVKANDKHINNSAAKKTDTKNIAVDFRTNLTHKRAEKEFLNLQEHHKKTITKIIPKEETKHTKPSKTTPKTFGSLTNDKTKKTAAEITIKPLPKKQSSSIAEKTPKTPLKVQAKNVKTIEKNKKSNITKSTQQKSNVKMARNLADVANATGLSKEFLSEIKNVEKLKTMPFDDGFGNLTIGIGHKILPHERKKLLRKLSLEEVYTIYKNDLLKAKKAIEKRTKGIKLTQGQKEAMFDLVFNIGPRCLSGTFVNSLRNGEPEKAEKELNFVLTNDQVVTGLCLRRIAITVKSFSKERPSENTLEAIQKLALKGNAVFDEQIRNETNPDSLKKLLQKKNNYWDEVKRSKSKITAEIEQQER